VRASGNNIVRVAWSLAVAGLITFLGIWAFLASIHDPSTWLKVAQVVALPFAALGSMVGLGSDLIYWVLLAVGFLIWTGGIFALLTMVGRRRDSKSVA
jgi:hypothetical protein